MLILSLDNSTVAEFISDSFLDVVKIKSSPLYSCLINPTSARVGKKQKQKKKHLNLARKKQSKKPLDNKQA